MDHFVKLERLPEDFVLPPQFQNRLEYDAKAQKLIFHGYMSKSEFDQISDAGRRTGGSAELSKTSSAAARRKTRPHRPVSAVSGPYSAGLFEENMNVLVGEPADELFARAP